MMVVVPVEIARRQERAVAVVGVRSSSGGSSSSHNACSSIPTGELVRRVGEMMDKEIRMLVVSFL